MTANSMVFLAGCLRSLNGVFDGRIESNVIVEMYNNALKIMQKWYGSVEFQTAIFFSGLAGFYSFEKKFEKALELYEQVLQVRLKSHGELHVDIAWTLNSIGNCYMKQPSMIHLAGDYYRQAIAVLESLSLEGSKNLGWTQVALARWLVATKSSDRSQLEEALFLVSSSIQIYEKSLPAQSPRLAQSLLLLAEVSFLLNHPIDTCMASLTRASQIFQNAYGDCCIPLVKCQNLLSQIKSLKPPITVD